MAGWTRARRAVAGLLAAALLAPAPACAGGHGDAGEHRDVILMIADGLGPQHLAAARIVSERVLDRPLCMAEVMRSGRTGYLLNDTADAIVTDSAAAATQMATGQRAIPRVLSMSPEPPPAGTVYRTILEIAQARGMATGLVTTSGITDATPGAFAAHVLDRGREAEVAEQELAHRVDVLMGGRRAFFLPRSAEGSRRGDERDLLAEARGAGYAVVEDERGLRQVTRGSVLGLFSLGDMAFEQARAGTGQPSRATMAEKALALLARGDRGFFVMIEGGRIDHAAHASDAADVVGDALAFDEAVCAARAFQRRHPEALLIVTSDHETGGLAIVGGGQDGAALVPDPAGRNVPPEVARLRVVFATGGHTASPVMVYGVGPGSDRLAGLHHNTELFEIMEAALSGR